MAAIPLQVLGEMLQCHARRRDLDEVAPKFLAVGKAKTAFLTGSVKGGGFKLQLQNN